MKAQFERHIREHFPFLLDSRVLLAISGGLDSLVLLHLCDSIGIEYGIAHCNFGLRGVESDGDAHFVSTLKLPSGTFSAINTIDITAFAKENKLSIQEAARNFRYEWFEDLLFTQDFDYVLTAHHANDNLETMLINLGRGTGLEGIAGIPEVNGKRVRVLLPFSRKRLEKFALDENIKWREDSSNASDKYVRNHLRHHAIPALMEAMPNLMENGAQLTKHCLDQSKALLKTYEIELAQRYTHPIDAKMGSRGIGVDLIAVGKHPNPDAVLYAILKNYNFTAWEDVYALRNAQAGKQILSATHRLVKDRDEFLVVPLDNDDDVAYTWEDMTSFFYGDFGRLSAQDTEYLKPMTKMAITVDASLLKLPLKVRKWKHGDFFHPFGMEGRKKLSKYFKDEKLSLIEKENIWLLCSEEDIVWIINRRADDRFKITERTTQRLLITYNDTTH